jgi:hypothetical protein
MENPSIDSSLSFQNHHQTAVRFDLYKKPCASRREKRVASWRMENPSIDSSLSFQNHHQTAVRFDLYKKPQRV